MKRIGSVPLAFCMLLALLAALVDLDSEAVAKTASEDFIGIVSSLEGNWSVEDRNRKNAHKVKVFEPLSNGSFLKGERPADRIVVRLVDGSTIVRTGKDDAGVPIALKSVPKKLDQWGRALHTMSQDPQLYSSAILDSRSLESTLEDSLGKLDGETVELTAAVKNFSDQSKLKMRLNAMRVAGDKKDTLGPIDVLVDKKGTNATISGITRGLYKVSTFNDKDEVQGKDGWVLVASNPKYDQINKDWQAALDRTKDWSKDDNPNQCAARCFLRAFLFNHANEAFAVREN